MTTVCVILDSTNWFNYIFWEWMRYPLNIIQFYPVKTSWKSICCSFCFLFLQKMQVNSAVTFPQQVTIQVIRMYFKTPSEPPVFPKQQGIGFRSNPIFLEAQAWICSYQNLFCLINHDGLFHWSVTVPLRDFCWSTSTVCLLKVQEV